MEQTQAILSRVKELITTSQRTVRIYKLAKPSQSEIEESLFGAYQMEYESHAVDPLPLRNINNVRENCKAISQWLSRTDAKSSLAIIGTVGTGKTTMLRAIQYFLQAVGIGIRYVCARDLPIIAEKDPDSFEGMLRPHPSYTFLLIDDVGEEPGEVSRFGNKISLFSRIVEGRYDYRIPTIITSNLSLADKSADASFATLYGDRVHERMVEIFNIRLMTGDSYREKATE